MKTITFSKKDMESRISRFSSLKPLPIQDASTPATIFARGCAAPEFI